MQANIISSCIYLFICISQLYESLKEKIIGVVICHLQQNSNLQYKNPFWNLLKNYGNLHLPYSI